MPISIAFLTPRQVEAHQPQIRQVYYEAFAGPPYNRKEYVADSFASSLVRHLTWPGFRFAAAMDEAAREVVGFAYGHTTMPGQWWHDLVALTLGRQRSAYWLSDCFELVEFAVTPAFQGQRLGSALHDWLLAGLPHRAAVLSTMQTETVALQLYRRRGWQELLKEYYFPGGSQPFLIMGLDRRGTAGAQGSGASK